MLFVTLRQGNSELKAFRSSLSDHKCPPEHVLEVVSDVSGAFLSAVPKKLPNAQISVDWFHIVQHFALDEERKAEIRIKPLPKHLRWAVLKRGEAERLTTCPLESFAELLAQGLDTTTAWRIKERLRWVRLARSPRAARRCITRFTNWASELIGETPLLKPMRQALEILRTQAERVVHRWVAARKLNAVRNGYAHAREPNEATRQIKRSLDLVEAYTLPSTGFVVESYRHAIAMLCAEIYQIHSTDSGVAE